MLSEEDLGKIWGLDRGQRICLKIDPITRQVYGWTLDQLGWETYPSKLLNRPQKYLRSLWVSVCMSGKFIKKNGHGGNLEIAYKDNVALLLSKKSPRPVRSNLHCDLQAICA